MPHDFRCIEWNRDKVADHGVQPDEAEFVIDHARRPYPMKIDDEKRLVWGQTPAGRCLQVIYLIDIEGSIFVIARAACRQGKEALAKEEAMKRKKPIEPALPGRYGQMGPAELDDEVAKFDDEFIAEKARPLTTKERKQDRKARRKLGAATRQVRITIESSLLQRSRSFCRETRTDTLHGDRPGPGGTANRKCQARPSSLTFARHRISNPCAQQESGELQRLPHLRLGDLRFPEF